MYNQTGILGYTCHDGRKLRHIRTESKEQDGYTQTVEEYGCVDRSGCEHKSKCLYKYNTQKNTERNKVMKINECWEELWEASNINIRSGVGILKRQMRSVRTEGYFGDIKENGAFSALTIVLQIKYIKSSCVCDGAKFKKYYWFLHHEIEKYEGKKEQKEVSPIACPEKSNKFFCALKRKRQSCNETQP